MFPQLHTLRGYSESNVLSAQVYSQSEPIIHLSPDLDQDMNGDEPDYVP